MTVSQNDVVRVDAVGSFNTTDQLVNVYQFMKTDAGALSDADALDDLLEILDAFYQIAKALSTVLTVWDRIRAQNLTTGLLLGELGFSTPIAGTATGEPGATQVAALITWKTNVPRVAMRKYLGTIAEVNLNTVGRFSGGVSTLLESLGAYLRTPITATNGTWRFGYLSPKTGNFEVPVDHLVSLIPATQRRRRQGVGS